jgi:hypothetical protein
MAENRNASPQLVNDDTFDGVSEVGRGRAIAAERRPRGTTRV